MVILFPLSSVGENLQVWMDLECSMDSKGKLNQLSFTMPRRSLGDSSCSYVWAEGTDNFRGTSMEKLTHCLFSVKMNKVAVLEKRIRQENSIGYFPHGMNCAMRFSEAAYSSQYLLPICEPFLYRILFRNKKYFHSLFSTWCLRISFSSC